jgi:hypothetical protein
MTAATHREAELRRWQPFDDGSPEVVAAMPWITVRLLLE